MSFKNNRGGILSTNGKFQYQYKNIDEKQEDERQSTKQSTPRSSLGENKENDFYASNKKEDILNMFPNQFQQEKRHSLFLSDQHSRQQTLVQKRKCQSAPNQFSFQEQEQLDSSDSLDTSFKGNSLKAFQKQPNFQIQNQNKNSAKISQYLPKIAVTLVFLLFCYSIYYFAFSQNQKLNEIETVSQTEFKITSKIIQNEDIDKTVYFLINQNNQSQDITNAVTIIETETIVQENQVKELNEFKYSHLVEVITYIDARIISEINGISLNRIQEYYNSQFLDGRWQEIKDRLLGYYQQDKYVKIEYKEDDTILYHQN